MYEDVLNFWFKELDSQMWWSADAELDGLIDRRFRALLQQAEKGELFGWRSAPQGRLTEIIVLDQFSRNIHRGTPAAFAQDTMALVLAQEAFTADAHKALTPAQCAFLFLPYMHSESPLIHRTAEHLFRAFTPSENLDFELRHKAIIDRFGRYPHRNKILARPSTAEEAEFLKQPGSSF